MSTFLADAKALWTSVGAGGLQAVLSELDAAGYDYEQIRAALQTHGEYALVDAGLADMVHPFTLANFDAAISAGLSGDGTTIAITDAGFDVDHPDLAGKTVRCFDGNGTEGAATCPEDSHGTAVSVVASGNLNDDGWMGVAHEADLLLFHWGMDLADQKDEAVSYGAVSWNNSWGFCFNGCITDDPIDNGNLGDFDDYLVNGGKYSLSRQAAIYDAYQDHGVVVFARSNDETRFTPESEYYNLPADLPALYPELKEAWITAINAEFYKDGGASDITSVTRLSAACGHSAEWCLTGTGTMFAAGYSSPVTGSSFVAPQIAGAVALVAEAFPTLTPAEWTARLLASADNSWFKSNQGVVYRRTTDEIYNSGYLDERCWNFGAGDVCHTYSLEWGHGIADLEAALSPIGGLSMVNGSNLQTAQRTGIGTAGLTASPGLENALRKALDVPVTVFDDLNGNFVVSGAALVANSDEDDASTAGTMLSRFAAGDDTETLSFAVGGVSFTARGARTADGWPKAFEFVSRSVSDGRVSSFGYTSSDLIPDFGGLDAGGDVLHAIGFAGLLGDTGYGAWGLESGRLGKVEVFGFTGENRYSEDGSVSGLGARAGRSLGRTDVQVSATFVAEEGSYLGTTGNQDLWFGGTTAIGAGRLAVRHDLCGGFALSGRVEAGIAGNGGQGALIADAEPAFYSGFAAELEKVGVFRPDDRIGLWASQPMRIEKSDVTFRLASGRKKDGTILYENYNADLSPEARQIDFGLTYGWALPGRNASAMIGIAHSFNAGHEAGETETGVAARLRMRF